jgi:uncharacterized protein (DUF433 family)
MGTFPRIREGVGCFAGKRGMNASTAPVWGSGIYPIRDAARFAHISPRTARRWIEGYDYAHKGRRLSSPPVAHLASPRPAKATEGTRASAAEISFEQLLTLMLVRAFKDRGLSLTKIKAASARAKVAYGLDNPFVSQQFRGDGNRVFVDLDPPATGKERKLIDVLSDQRQFREIVEPTLFRDVVFIGDRAGQWWPLDPDRSVVLTPGLRFGAPHIARTGVRTDVIAQMVDAEGSGDGGVDAAVDWFGLSRNQVKDAAEFEGRWLSEPLG